MTAPLDLEALRAALATIADHRDTHLGWEEDDEYSEQEYPKLRDAHIAVDAALAELTTRRARDAEAAVLIASELARIDGFDPEDQHGGLYDLRWSGGPNPEPEGDAWHMDYLPKGERIAAALANLTGATP